MIWTIDWELLFAYAVCLGFIVGFGWLCYRFGRWVESKTK